MSLVVWLGTYLPDAETPVTDPIARYVTIANERCVPKAKQHHLSEYSRERVGKTNQSFQYQFKVTAILHRR